VEGEGLQVTDEVLEQIAKLSDGGFRDGTKILEELVALSGGGKITESIFEEKHQVSSVNTKIETLLKACENREIKAAFDVVTALQSEGTDISFFLSEVILTLHTLLLEKVGIETDNLLVTNFDIAEIKRLIYLFSRATSEMKYAVVPTLPLELALVEWCQANTTMEIETSELPAQEKNAQRTEITVSTLRRQAGNMAKERAINGDTTEKVVRVKSDPAEVSILKYRATGDHTPEWMDALWKNTVSEVKNHNHMIAGVLRSCRLISYDREVLVIEAAAKFHKEKLEEAKTFAALTAVCIKLIGNPVQIKIELKTN
jgi:DNA polymerase-3 subunit gamma/tau